jgi:death-on-curing protein
VTVYLSVEQILLLHRRQLRAFGGAAGLRDRGRLEAAVARPQLTFGGEDLYPDPSEKAAALMHALIANHPFVDGNKRVAAMTAELFLAINRVQLVASDDELVATALAVARGEVSAEALAIWIRQRTREREG